MSKIQEIRDKIKPFLLDDAIYTAILVLLVGTASFGLGRQSAGQPVPSERGEGGETAATFAAAASSPVPSKPSDRANAETLYVASKNSNKYHLPWCSGAKRISEANKIYFNSKEEAAAAGYQPAANCPGI